MGNAFGVMSWNFKRPEGQISQNVYFYLSNLTASGQLSVLLKLGHLPPDSLRAVRLPSIEGKVAFKRGPCQIQYHTLAQAR